MDREEDIDELLVNSPRPHIDLSLYMLMAYVDRDNLSFCINDGMLRSLPPDHPVLASIEPWELPGLFTEDEDPERDDEDSPEIDDMSEEECREVLAEMASGRWPALIRGDERQAIPAKARLASTTSFLSSFPGSGTDDFLRAIEAVWNDFGSVPKAVRAIEPDEPWKGLRAEDEYDRIRKLVEDRYASFSRTVIACFGIEAMGGRDTGGLERVISSCSMPNQAPFQVIQGFAHQIYHYYHGLLHYISTDKTFRGLQ